jgi:predicted RNA-binding Zn ribbon-like protein
MEDRDSWEYEHLLLSVLKQQPKKDSLPTKAQLSSARIRSAVDYMWEGEEKKLAICPHQWVCRWHYSNFIRNCRMQTAYLPEVDTLP